MMNIFPIVCLASLVYGLGLKTQVPTMSDLVDIARNAEALGPYPRVRSALCVPLVRFVAHVRRCVRQGIRQAAVGRREQQSSYVGKRFDYGSCGTLARDRMVIRISKGQRRSIVSVRTKSSPKSRIST